MIRSIRRLREFSWRSLLALAVVLILGACVAAPPPGTPAGTSTLAEPSATSSPSLPTSTSTAVPQATPQVTASATLPAKPTGNPADYRVEIAASGLQIPWGLAFAPDGRLFFTERPGRVRVIVNGQLQSDPVATIDVAAVGEGGLLGIALDPEFSKNGFLYLYYTYYEGPALRNRVVRYREQGGRLVEPQTLIEGIPGGGNHDGGRIAFGPDGKLYIGTGEGGKRNLAQQLDSLGGKILRINADGSIPADNPFPGSPVYSYGHRNVQGLAWTPSGLMLATEHGPTGENGWYAHDEFNIIRPGKNYGWPVVIDSPGDPRFVDPLIQSGNDTWAPSGLTFYNGDLLSAWKGSLFFAGLRGQALYRVVLGGPASDQVVAQEELFKGKYGRLRVVAQGPDGALYFATNNRDGRGTPGADDDRILRIVPGA